MNNYDVTEGKMSHGYFVEKINVPKNNLILTIFEKIGLYSARPAALKKRANELTVRFNRNLKAYQNEISSLDIQIVKSDNIEDYHECVAMRACYSSIVLEMQTALMNLANKNYVFNEKELYKLENRINQVSNFKKDTEIIMTKHKED